MDTGGRDNGTVFSGTAWVGAHSQTVSTPVGSSRGASLWRSEQGPRSVGRCRRWDKPSGRPKLSRRIWGLACGSRAEARKHTQLATPPAERFVRCPGSLTERLIWHYTDSDLLSAAEGGAEASGAETAPRARLPGPVRHETIPDLPSGELVEAAAQNPAGCPSPIWTATSELWDGASATPAHCLLRVELDPGRLTRRCLRRVELGHPGPWSRPGCAKDPDTLALSLADVRFGSKPDMSRPTDQDRIRRRR